MSLYTNQIKTNIVDPVYFDQNRCEFKLTPSKLFMSNMRLGGVGYVANTPATDTFTNPAGVWGQVKNIFLMDGGTELDKQYDVKEIMAFKIANNSNDVNFSKNKALSRSFVGYESNYNRKLTEDRAEITTTPPLLRDQGWLSLMDVFDFLRNTIYVSTNMFKHLRLVIEFNPIAVEPNATAILRPFLIVDEIIDENAIQNIEKELMKTPVVFKPIERDSVVLSDVASGVSQFSNFNLKGFTGKTLNRVLVCKSTATNISLGIDSEEVNFIINGRQIIPYNGIDTSSKRASYLSDSWGAVNMIPAQNIPNFNAAKKVQLSAALPQKNDFVGLKIDESINEFQLTYFRQTTVAGSLVALNLLIYGEVNKVFNPNNGDYRIDYL